MIQFNHALVKYMFYLTINVNLGMKRYWFDSA